MMLSCQYNSFHETSQIHSLSYLKCGTSTHLPLHTLRCGQRTGATAPAHGGDFVPARERVTNDVVRVDPRTSTQLAKPAQVSAMHPSRTQILPAGKDANNGELAGDAHGVRSQLQKRWTRIGAERLLKVKLRRVNQKHSSQTLAKQL